MKQDANIDELLNSFLDGEATERERTEVERLIAHDPEIAKRMGELEKCRMLVSSLPYAEAPAKIVEEVKASVGNMPVRDLEAEAFEQREGARHLLIRQVVSVAAMVALVAVLGVVIYTILGPESFSERPMTADDLKLPAKKIEVEPEGAAQRLMAKADSPSRSASAERGKPTEGLERFLKGFSGRLELKTRTLIAADASVNRAIEDSGLARYVVSRRDGGQRVYTVAGSREAVNLLLSDLANIWERFDSTRLLVETGQADEGVVVDNVKTEQIAEIIKQDSPEGRIRVAKDIAAFNRIGEQLPGKEIFAAISYESGDLLTIPKPVLTSSEKTGKKPAGRQEDGEKVHLTIVVVGSE